jgi:hypothetical protein
VLLPEPQPLELVVYLLVQARRFRQLLCYRLRLLMFQEQLPLEQELPLQ